MSTDTLFVATANDRLLTLVLDQRIAWLLGFIACVGFYFLAQGVKYIIEDVCTFWRNLVNVKTRKYEDEKEPT